jgi:hypothetical protein
MNILNGPRSGIFLAVAAAALALSGCGGGANDDLPLIRATISVKSVSFGGVCETVPVRLTPKALSGVANKYSNNKMMVTDVPTTGPTDENGAPMCNGSAETLPIAPGEWEFSAPLRSDTYKCVRDIQAGGDLNVAFVDGVDGCGGPEAAAAAAEAPAAVEAAAAEGEAPATEGAAPAAQ